MTLGFEANPGRLYAVATLLPLVAFSSLLLAGGMRAWVRPYRKEARFAARLYRILGGERPLKTGACFATACIALSAALAAIGLVLFLSDPSGGKSHTNRWAERTDWVRLGPQDPTTPAEWQKQRSADPMRKPPRLGIALEIGYRIDALTAVVFAMVTGIAALIFIFSLAYMKDEAEESVEDHEVDLQRRQGKSLVSSARETHEEYPEDQPTTAEHRGFSRRGRFGRFYLYLSLFCFAMLNLTIADNLFQVFVSWELVGVCSYFLIGFYYERPSAARAASKAFIVNRIGDAGFMVGILLAWTYFGTLNFEEMFHRLRAPGERSDSPSALIRIEPEAEIAKGGTRTFSRSETGSYVALSPLASRAEASGDSPPTPSRLSVPIKGDCTTFNAMPYGLFVLMGLGIFLGCVGKSAQIPLHTWLPDAMEGPTPVSALIHAATMVAAGVYLVGRCYPLFAPEVLLVIAYVGAVTLFSAATIALVQTDIKRILAYSTCSQLGFMMLALGIGGWVAGLLHLIAHAFFKALLFLGAGSVINGCHHEQDVRKMGGLRKKMPITAYAMLVGVLAISGMPLLSGWYSKDQILEAAFAFGFRHTEHSALLLVPLIATGFTAFYMFRLWFLTFAGKPRDEYVSERAHESPRLMTVPLIVLAIFSIGVAWGWPLWKPGASYLGHVLARAEPSSVLASEDRDSSSSERLNLSPSLTTGLPLLFSLLGAGIAYRYFGRRQPMHSALYARGNLVYRFLLEKWYFDEVYTAAIVDPTVKLAQFAAACDKRPTAAESPPKRFDFLTLDGAFNSSAQLAGSLGGLVAKLQTGRLRTYILALGLTAALLLGMLVLL